MEELELKPCPFCGGENLEYVSDDYCDVPYIHIECSDCGARSAEANSPNCKYILAMAWNTRAKETE